LQADYDAHMGKTGLKIDRNWTYRFIIMQRQSPLRSGKNVLFGYIGP
jgi:hypothetical protein